MRLLLATNPLLFALVPATLGEYPIASTYFDAYFSGVRKVCEKDYLLGPVRELKFVKGATSEQMNEAQATWKKNQLLCEKTCYEKARKLVSWGEVGSSRL